MDKAARKDEINRCLDEIEAAYRIMVKKKATKEVQSKCKGWVRKHKAILKELNYKGKIPRQPKTEKKPIKEKTLFEDEE